MARTSLQHARTAVDTELQRVLGPASALDSLPLLAAWDRLVGCQSYPLLRALAFVLAQCGPRQEGR